MEEKRGEDGGWEGMRKVSEGDGMRWAYAVGSVQVVPVTAFGFTVVDARRRRTSKWSCMKEGVVWKGIAVADAASSRVMRLLYISLVLVFLNLGLRKRMCI